MIIVQNTRELEEKYNLNQIPDNEQIRVVGGMANKSKYNEERYQRRSTYTARQMKQIIQQMKIIENAIPENWNKWQRAKYIYEVLASNVSYNYDRDSYKNQQSSNLTILLSRKGICAGYALTFKEMMDRQGIECDYIRGNAFNSRGGQEKHAWNVLTIEGLSIPVDLTWDSGRRQRGEEHLAYFGNNPDFFREYIQDSDEKIYQMSLINNESVKSIDISQTNKKQISIEEKRNVIKLAIEETYKKYSNRYGDSVAYNQVNEAIKKFIKEQNLNYFTRDGGARQAIENSVSQKDMLGILIEDYVEQNVFQENQTQDVLAHALRQTSNKYGYINAISALESYITEGNIRTLYQR